MHNSHNNPPHVFRLNLVTAAVSLALLGGAGQLSAQAPEVEEVTVTGSYIRRSEGINAASPLTTFTAEDIESQGTVNMAQVVQNLTFNNGTGVTNSIQGTTNQIASFNLRGLGPRATLLLVDGKRVATDNVQLLLPPGALQSLEVVTDGAATLYGTDAVAGVVNMVPWKSYDGFELEYYEEGDTRGDYRKIETSFVGGTSFGDVDIVVAGSYTDGATLSWLERPDYVAAGLTHNSGSNPGNFEVPLRDANGNLTGAKRNRPDPNCGRNEDADQALFGNSPWGTLFGGRCWLSFGDTRDFQEQIDVTSLYSNMSWDFSSDLTFNAQVIYNRQVVRGRENPGNPGARVAELPTVRGELPGNTFRARTSAGQDLFAEPLRNASGGIVLDGYGRPLPKRGADGNVILAANRFADISTNPLGGVPFSEDVRIGAWLPFGKAVANTQPTLMQKWHGLNMELDDKRTMRIALDADFTVPVLEGWEGTAFYTYGYSWQNDVAQQDFSFGAVRDGLNCDVINAVDTCFNPFAAVDPRFRTPQAVADAIYTRFRDDNTDYLQTFDVILNGDVPLGGFELPGGPIAAAVGYERRQEIDDNIPPATDIANDQLIGTKQSPNRESRYSNSWFAEFSFPVLDNVEVSASVRDEDFSTGQGEVISKYGVIYSPLEWLTLRATTGEAFIVPTLSQLNRPEFCGLSNVNDLFSSFSGFITSCATGNSNLIPETSDSISAGFDLALGDFDFSLTWSETDFTDRIVSTTTQDIVRTDFRNFQLATGFTPSTAQPYPSEQLLAQWVADSRSDKRIQRSPSDITTPVRINQSDSNASKMLVRAVDVTANYGFSLGDIGLDSSWGDINMQLQATYVDTYTFQLSILDPVREAKGNQNSDYGAVPTIPEWRANLRINWSMGPHTVSTTTRYVDEVDFDGNEFSFQAGFPGARWGGPTDVLKAWTQMDAFYNYRGFEALGGEFNLTVGLRNVFDRMPQKTGMIAGVVADMQDVLGRTAYVRVNYNF